MRTLVALFVAAALAGAAFAQDEKSSESSSVITVNGKTIEVVGPGGASVSSDNGKVVIQSGGQEIRIDGNKIVVGGATRDLPDFTHLKLTQGKNGLEKVEVDGEDLTALLQLADALGEAGKALGEAGKALGEAGEALAGEGGDDDEDEGKGKGAEDRFPADQVKSIVIQGLHQKFAVQVDPEAKEVVVKRKGSVAAVGAKLEEGTLTVKGVSVERARVTVVTPPGLALKVKDCRGGTIGDLGGDVVVHTVGSESVNIGKVRSAEVSLSGSGEVSIASVEGGDLKVDILGSGDVEIAGGTAAQGNLTISGSGNIVCRAKIAKATLRVLGTGDMEVVEPGEILDRKVLGTGSIDIVK